MKVPQKLSLKRKPNVTLLLIFSLVIFLCYLNNHYKLYAFNFTNSKEVLMQKDSCFDIMIFNVDACNQDDFHNGKQVGILKVLNEVQPDIVCFQELALENYQRIQQQLDSIYGMCYTLSEEDKPYRTMFYSRFKMRTFTRHKCVGKIDTVGMNDTEKLYVENKQKKMDIMSAEVEVHNGRWIRLFSGHLRSSAYSTARRSMDKDANWFEGLSLYKRNYEIGKRIRDYEAQNVRRFVDDARAQGKPVIIAGDLNDWCGSDCLNNLMGNDLKDAWWEGGNGFGWTYFGWHLRLRLDHILYCDEFELVDVKVVDSDLSDHKPLVARLRFKK